MRFVDTHCHLDLEQFSDDLVEVLKRASDAGVERVIAPGISVESSRKAVRIAREHETVFAAVGIHPHEADRIYEGDIRELRDLATSSDKVVAIGEIGVDHYRKYSSPENQVRLFRACLEIARDLDLPVILHSREAHGDLVRVLREVFPSGKVKGVLHCFPGGEELAEAGRDMGLFVSFAGNITFSGAGSLREAARQVEPERLLLETDAPYMSPEPLRGRRNEPANVRYLTGIYADIYGLTPEDMARMTTHNANSLFMLGLDEPPRVAYPIRSSLYLNITTRCSNRCVFCTRQGSNFVKGHNLRLTAEPRTEEIIASLGDLSRFSEVVFCGYGEPTLRLGALKSTAAYVRENGVSVRLNTNGQGDLINARSIAPELKGLVDSVAMSLNAPDSDRYGALCRPVFGEKAFGAVVDFMKSCTENGMKVEATCLDLLEEGELAACRSAAERAGAVFRLRRHNVVG